MSASSVDGLYYDYHWPLSLKMMVDEFLGHRTQDANSPVPDTVPAVRQWFSQPRKSDDATTEVLTANFKLPLSVSEISFEVQRVPMRIELWYQDRRNNWRAALDHNRIPVSVTLTSSSQISWYKHHTRMYPIVAKAIQLRCTRIPDASLGDSPYSIGVRNVLPRRNVYDRSSGLLPFEDELDPMGNVVAKYIKDWDAPRAIDDQPLTFWRSAPMPDHQAVTSLYLDYRKADGSPQLIDGIYIDPVYIGQTLNIYYSNDENVGTRKINSITLPPSEDINTQWRADRGRWDSSTPLTGSSSYKFPLAVGPLVEQSLWFGIEWTPDFEPLTGPARSPVLFESTPSDPDPQQWWPKIFYDVGSGGLTVTLTNSEDEVKTYSVPLTPLYVFGDTLRIVVGWRYNPQELYISVRLRDGTELARLIDESPDLPSLITIDGQAGFTDFRGNFTSHIVKMENYLAGGAESYLANPGVYVSPEPVIPDKNGKIPSTTLDNAVFVADWTVQRDGSGGSHESFYEDKIWTPIWRDYLTYRGKLFFPQAISLRYLKLEFTNLTEEPYPVYDAGIQTTYRVFPVQVQQLASRKNLGLLGNLGGMLQLGAELVLGAVGIGSVNWLNPSSVSRAVDAIFGRTAHPVTVTAGTGINLAELPKTVTSSLVTEARTEEANPYVYRRDPVDPVRLAGQIISQLVGQQIQTLIYTNGVVADSILNSFTPLVDFARNPSALPVQGDDWWLFPGGTLALPAAVMNGLTAATDVVMGRKPTIETRIRFMTASVHRYDVKTVTRDAALAYFAGIREVRAMLTTYIDEQDSSVFDFNPYDPERWLFNNVRQLDTGPVTTAGKVYTIENPGFDQSLAFWDEDPGDSWQRDPAKGRWHWGSAYVDADGTEKNLRSSHLEVTEGNSIGFSCWVAWDGVLATNDLAGIALGGTTYANGEPIADIVFDDVVFENWSEHVFSYDPDEEIEGFVLRDDGLGFFIIADVEDAFLVDDGDGFFTILTDGVWPLLNEEGESGLFVPGSEQVEDIDNLFVDGGLQEEGDSGLFLVYEEGHPHLQHDGNGLYTMVNIGDQYTPAWVKLSGSWTAPAGVDEIAVRLSVTEDVGEGRVWFDTIKVISEDEVIGTVYKNLVTTSTFSKARCVFHDSGMVRSDAMWARDDPNNTNIDNLKLAYYVSTIPDGSLPGNWNDPFATWADDTVTWGSVYSVVAVSIDPDRIFDGRRVLRLTRAAGTGGAGIKIFQTTNFVASTLARLCVTFFKPESNANQVTLRLRRLSDGVFIHEETITNPAVGYWHHHKGQFFEVPSGDDQVYTVEMTAVGDAEEDIYINDLYTELSHVRYFMRLGGAGQFLHDVTALRYADSAQIVATDPVNEISVQAAIMTPKAFIYSCSVMPQYLQ